jgi:ligand-binding SRPBCC domain-containing protein
MTTRHTQSQNVRIFEKSLLMKSSPGRVNDFHGSPQVFQKLTPPLVFVQIHEDNRASLTEGDLKFTLWVGPIPVRWQAQHQPGANEYSFADLMLSGPMHYWLHEHIVEAADMGVKLTDRVTYSHKSGLWGLYTRLVFSRLALQMLFFYRHFQTRRAVEG